MCSHEQCGLAGREGLSEVCAGGQLKKLAAQTVVSVVEVTAQPSDVLASMTPLLPSLNSSNPPDGVVTLAVCPPAPACVAW